MKKNTIYVAFSLMLIASAFTFSFASSNNISDINQLRSLSIPDDCVSNSNTDCRSEKTGNIYPDYKVKSSAEETVE